MKNLLGILTLFLILVTCQTVFAEKKMQSNNAEFMEMNHDNTVRPQDEESSHTVNPNNTDNLNKINRCPNKLSNCLKKEKDTRINN